MTDLRDRFRDLDRLDVPDVYARARSLGPKPAAEHPTSRGRRFATAVFALALAAAALLFVVRALDPAPAPTPATPEPTISSPVPPRETESRILFLHDGEGFVIKIDGTAKKRFASRESLDVATTLSPDGSHLAFAAVNEQGLIVGGSVGVDGTGYRVFDSPDATLNLACAWWGPQDRIACEGWDDTDPSRDGIYTVRSSDGGGLKRLTHRRDYPCSYSPDGTELAFVRVTQNIGTRTEAGKLMVMDADGGDAQSLVEGVGESGLACDWSPDGSKIIAGRSDGSIVLVTPDGEQTPFTAVGLDGYSEGFVWSSDGSRILFSMNRDGQFDVYSIAADGSDLTRITDSEGDEFGLAWLP